MASTTSKSHPPVSWSSCCFFSAMAASSGRRRIRSTVAIYAVDFGLNVEGNKENKRKSVPLLCAILGIRLHQIETDHDNEQQGQKLHFRSSQNEITNEISGNASPVRDPWYAIDQNRATHHDLIARVGHNVVGHRSNERGFPAMLGVATAT